MAWKADTTTVTADSTYATADGYAPTTEWRADTTHFTVDDDVNHTADGWHQDVAANQRGTWYGFQNRQAYMARLRDDEEVIMGVITEFLDKAA